jgi:hypothetical protein
MSALRKIFDKLSRFIEDLPAGPIDPWILWWIALALLLPLLAR